MSSDGAGVAAPHSSIDATTPLAAVSIGSFSTFTARAPPPAIKYETGVQAAKLIDADSVLAAAFRAREVGTGRFRLNERFGRRELDARVRPGDTFSPQSSRHR
jgi:hypothetical protein